MNFNSEKMYHIGLHPEQGAGYVLLTGDPGRVESIARRLDSPEPVACNREYTSWAGNLAGRRMLVISHGIGGPPTAICVEELVKCGAHTLIRVGTCGGMAHKVVGGDLVVASAAIPAGGHLPRISAGGIPGRRRFCRHPGRWRTAPPGWAIPRIPVWCTVRIPSMGSTAPRPRPWPRG